MNNQDGAQKPTKAERLASQIASSLAGRAAGAVRIHARLTGPSADAWRAIRQASEGLDMDDTALLAALLQQGGTTLRAALKKVPRPGGWMS